VHQVGYLQELLLSILKTELQQKKMYTTLHGDQNFILTIPVTVLNTMLIVWLRIQLKHMTT